MRKPETETGSHDAQLRARTRLPKTKNNLSPFVFVVWTVLVGSATFPCPAFSQTINPAIVQATLNPLPNSVLIPSSTFTGSLISIIPAPGTAADGITVHGDTVPEATETFFLKLTSATNAIIAAGQGVGTIIDEDTVLPVSCSAESLQTAVNSAISGQVLSVVGTCNENILVRNDKVRVFLNGGGTTMINGPDATRPVIDVRGKAVSIQGFIITGGSSGIEIQRGANAVIDSNVIDGTAGHGVVVNQLAFAVLTNNAIQNNEGDGVVVKEGAAARIGFNSGNESMPILNTIQMNSGNGITVAGSSSARGWWR